MSDQTTANDLVSQLVPLTTARWELARTRAEELVRGRIKAPLKAQYTVTDSEYPQSLIVVVLALMVIVALAAFYISAGKEIMAADMISAELATVSIRISGAYVAGVLLAVLLLCECGALLFGLGSRIVAQRRQLSAVLRVFQVVCVMIAIVANATVTLAYPVGTAMIFDWFITLVAPILVIGVGLIIEELLASWLVARKTAIDSYNRAMNDWRAEIDDPAKHPDFNRLWGESILEQLIGASKHNREVLPALIDETPQLRAIIVSREYQRHQWGFDPSTANRVTLDFQKLFQKIPEISEISQKVSEKIELSKADAISILQADPLLMKVKAKDLIVKHGGSPATWTRAKQDMKVSQ